MAFFEEWANLHRHGEAAFKRVIGLHVAEAHSIQESLLMAKPLSTISTLTQDHWVNGFTEKKLK